MSVLKTLKCSTQWIYRWLCNQCQTCKNIFIVKVTRA